MNSSSPGTSKADALRQSMRAALVDVRRRTLELIGPLSDDALTRQHDPLMSPILWDLGHIGAFEELWLVRRPGAVTSEGELEEVYDAFRTPRSVRGDLELPGPRDVLARMADVRARALERLTAADFKEDNPLLRDGFAWKMVRQHEAQHQETILQTIQLMTSEAYEPVLDRPAPSTAAGVRIGEMIEMPGGSFEMGAAEGGFAYDNERPRHLRELSRYRIGRFPVTNGEWAEFVADGGYLRRELWTEAGWAWRERSGLAVPGFWRLAEGDGAPVDAGAAARLTAAEGLDGWRRSTSLGSAPVEADVPVIHVCAHEADAFATFRGMRLPTEAEWEMAAAYDPSTGGRRPYPWGESPPSPHLANLDQSSFGPRPAGAYPDGASAVGCEQMLGDVWEWTSSTFEGYPGFRAFPYPEYSEVFFGGDYRVLRGASWATRPAVARNTFRNWDYPIRRQIFSGLRLAEDA